MDFYQLLDFLTIAMIVGLGLYLKLTSPTKNDLDDLDHALATVLQGLGERLQSLDDLVELLPSLVPSVNLTNQNPLISIIEAFQKMKQGSNNPTFLRDADGRFEEHGTNDKETESGGGQAETEPTEIILD
jgi:hypothetical protein